MIRNFSYKTLITTASLVFLQACFHSSKDTTNTTIASGLSQRPQNTSCQVPSSSSTQINVQKVFGNLSFAQPLAMLQAPGNNDRWYIVEKGGRIYWFDARDDNTSTRYLYIDLSATIDTRNEGGLLSMTFHPNFAVNGQVYLSFTQPDSIPNSDPVMHSYVALFTSHDDHQTLDPISRIDIITVPQPYTNHNGGHIAFGPDGFLYFGLGDGGSGNDPFNHAQNTNTLLGSLLRINVDHGIPYTIPQSNPFAISGGRPEIYAYGLRNPWRWNFDKQTGLLWLADVGQNQYEEINIITKGSNYGWRCLEGLHITSNNCTTSGPYVAPVAEYDHSEGFSVTGGYVYRGPAIPGLNGVYIFGDFGSGNIWGLFAESNGKYRRELLNSSNLNISSFAESNEGELYIVNYSGDLYRITPASGNNTPMPAAFLSKTGCVQASAPRQASTSMIPYDINEPFWSDNAEKERFIALPNNRQISINVDGDLNLPNGTVLLKHFRLNGRLIETRLLSQSIDGHWYGYSYEWNDNQTEATLLSTMLDKTIDGQNWHYPSPSECLQCHTQAAGFSLGLELRQLNREFTYTNTGKTANQISTWDTIGLFDKSPNTTLITEKLIPSNNQSADLNARARSYLHSNCAYCHQPDGPVGSNMDLRINIALQSMAICDAIPQHGDLGISNARLLSPRDSDRSVLLERILRLDENRMPPSSSQLIDNNGVRLITDWINSLNTCN